MPPRLVFRRPGLNDYIIYTDAAYEGSRGGIAAVVFDPEFNRTNGSIRAIYVIRSYESSQINQIVEMFKDSSPIFGLELAAVTISIFQLRYFLMHRTITIFVDNNAVLGALVKGTSRVLVARRFISTFWWIVSMFSISVWFERVASEWNCADAPSRNVRLPFPTRHDDPFGSLEEFLSIQESIFSDSFEVLTNSGNTDSMPASFMSSDDTPSVDMMDIDSDEEHV